MAQDKVGVALFGLGRAGQYHLPGLAANPDVHIRWMVDVVSVIGDKGNQLCRQYGHEDCQFLDFDDCQQVFDDPRTAAVVVTTPTRFHETLIKRAVTSGKHVFCEKPMSFTADAVKSCYEEAQKHGCVLFCGFNRRFEKHHAELRQTVQSGKLGLPRVVHAINRDPGTSSGYVSTYIHQSGGIFCDSAIHYLDYLVWLLGEKPSSVMAVGTCRSAEAEGFRACGDVDQMLVTLQFPSQALAHIEVIRDTAPDFHYVRMEVVGTEGTHFFHNVTTDSLVSQTLDGRGQEVRTTLDMADSFRREMDCFVRVVQGKEECPVLAEEVIFTSHLAELCLTSLREQRVVKV